MPDRFSELLSFIKIAESGTLSDAARKLDLSVAATSRRLSQLEARLGVALVRRNSRNLTLTDDGALFYERAGMALAGIEELESEMARRATEAVGLLRVVTTINVGRARLAPLFRHYGMLHPGVTIHLETAEQVANIVESGHDIAIAFDPPAASGLKMKRLSDNPRLLCASPAYLKRRGRPTSVSDLQAHDNVVVGPVQQDLWRGITVNGRGPRVTLSTNDGEMGRAWVLDGAGIAIKSLWEVSDDLAHNRLQPVLPEISLPSSSIAALYLPGQGETAKVRSCLDFLSRHLKQDHTGSG